MARCGTEAAWHQQVSRNPHSFSPARMCNVFTSVHHGFPCMFSSGRMPRAMHHNSRQQLSKNSSSVQAAALGCIRVLLACSCLTHSHIDSVY